MAVYFNGVGSQRLDTISSFTPPAVGTICFWKKADAGALRIFGSGTNWEARQTSDTLLTHEYMQSAQPASQETAVGVIEHWAFAYDGTNKKIYKNGVLLNEGVYAHGTQGASTLSIGSSFHLPAQAFKGWLEDVRVYMDYKSDAIIQTIYATKGTDGIIINLLHRWTLTEGADDAAVVQAKDIIGGLHANPVGTGVSKYVNGIISTRRKLS